MSDSEATDLVVDEQSPFSASENVDSKIAVVDWIEWTMSILLCAVVLFFVVARTLNAGPLWRDECDSLQLATMPRFTELLKFLHFTAFPILFPAIVRTYTSLFGTSDVVLRCFGLAVGVLFLGVAWFQARTLGRGVPLLLPALIGLNLNFITAGLWLRGYGLGSALIVLAFTITAKFLLQPSGKGLFTVFLAYLASMQCLYFNGALVPAIVIAATAVLLIRREWKWMWLLLGVALVCGLTYLPYIWEIYTSTVTWAVLVQIPFSWKWLLRGFLAACGGPKLIGKILWWTIIGLCLAAGAWRLKVVWRTNRTRERDLLLFALFVIPLAVLAQFGFLRLMRNIVIQRYHLACISLVAAGASVIAANISWRYWRSYGRIAVGVMAMGAVALAPWGKLNERKSNIDVVAHRVETDAGPNDLIVVNDAQLGISFNHYYRGTNRWMTLPVIDDHRIHRYDLMQKKMMEVFPLDDLKKEMTATLKSGNRVWIVGTIGKPLERSETLLAPAPDPEYGWRLPSYNNAWSRELGTFIRRHAGRMNVIVRKGESVSMWENLQLIACEGWRY